MTITAKNYEERNGFRHQTHTQPPSGSVWSQKAETVVWSS